MRSITERIWLHQIEKEACEALGLDESKDLDPKKLRKIFVIILESKMP